MKQTVISNSVLRIKDILISYPKTGYDLNICLVLIMLLEEGYADNLNDIAVSSSIDPSNLYKFLRNKFSFSIDNLFALCSTYNIDANVILGIYNPKKGVTENAIKKYMNRK